MVFASDQQNTIGTDYDGFAFDNLMIIERSHNVLFEHFDNLNSSDPQFDFVNQMASDYNLDMIPIQYHNDFPSADTIYQNNSSPVESRAAIYDINRAPRSFMDGFMSYDYSSSVVEPYEIVNRSLEIPTFDISIDTIPTGRRNMVEFDVTIIANKPLNEEVVVYIMPIETSISGTSIGVASIDTLNNIVKEMLPAGGYPYQHTWTPGMSRNLRMEWDLNLLNEENVIYDKSKLGVVVFIQNNVNEGSREVYQAEFMKLHELEQVIITGIEDELNVKKFADAVIYPNPAQHYFNVSLEDYLTLELNWTIIDQRGVTLLDGVFEAGESTYQIDTKSLPEGLHMFIVSSGSDYKTIRKIIIQR